MSVTSTVSNGVGTITFATEKKNSLPATVLAQLAESVTALGRDPNVRVIILRSGGDGPFCAGASFDELLAVTSTSSGTAFFLGFARVILAMRACPKFIIARVHGSAIGGGVGLVAACDYAYATDQARIRLSELALGIGPFVIGPVVERRVGTAAYGQLAIEADWRDATWARDRGLYADIFKTVAELDQAISARAQKLASFSPEAMARLKAVLWEGTDHWPQLLEARARISGELVVTPPAAAAIAAAKRS
ncbi:MAG: enoyl-CoA hydratase/isomerase family protein [Planctomycetota bacterium]